MPRTITFQDALEEGIISTGDYFLTTAPKDRRVITRKGETGFDGNQKFKIKAGAQKLWRLENGLKMVGELTEEKLTLKGSTGFEEGPDTMHRVARELYSIPDIFEQVRACSLTKKIYLATNVQKVLGKEANRYIHSDNKKLVYWLASCCIYLKRYRKYFRVFYVRNGSVNASYLCSSYGMTGSNTHAVRPEATPKTTLLLETERCDGTKSKPWKCLGK